MCESGGRQWNTKESRLINEKPPYLLQHANGPVNGYHEVMKSLKKQKGKNLLSTYWIFHLPLMIFIYYNALDKYFIEGDIKQKTAMVGMLEAF
ncbi:MAG: hypothetical protein K0R93_2743 [Anaerosolibacter sp.]|jgi:hypothetical protein|uniref:hypothetical protein n=1 Tax=Anaerosolibacter sp. TaxID=1872527 RepID=UPI0026104C18|nr:hypothetical protein [Anaerosolibacter sp.]MDF2547845.1 hypothetical protein [Anaerosolibacter sp.]